MTYRFESVEPDQLAVGDEVLGNGALWRITGFQTLRSYPAAEMINVLCIDPIDTPPFAVGSQKQFARHARTPDGNNRWQRRLQ